ncbi:MAG: hypothetical protein ACTSQE_00265 [Candidatus Heimdallarchaeaceae archaeon]
MTQEVDLEKYNLLKENAKKIADKISTLTGTHLIFVKPTTDNLCAAGILLNLLRTRTSGVHITYFIENFKQKIKELKYSYYWFIGWDLNIIPPSVCKGVKKEFFFINHKISQIETKGENLENVHFLSLAGTELSTKTLSTSGLVYFIAKAYEENYQRFAPLAIMGALSVNQIEHKTQELIGINRIILNEAIDAKVITVIKGTKIRGRESKPIHLALKYSTNPFFPGLTGNEQACTSFLSRLGISMRDADNKWRTISDLTADETRALNDGLISLLMSKGKDAIQETYKLIGPIYIINKEEKKRQTRNIEEFLQLIEGACNLGFYGLALAVLIGNRTNQYNQLLREVEGYYGESTKAINTLEENPSIIEEHNYFRIIKGNDLVENNPYFIFKTLCKSQAVKLDKPVIFLFKEENNYRFFIHESPSQERKGYKIYPIFAALEQEKLVANLSEQVDFFQTLVEETKLEEVIKNLKDKLDYHYKGKITEEKQEEEKKTPKETKKIEKRPSKKNEESKQKKEITKDNNIGEKEESKNKTNKPKKKKRTASLSNFLAENKEN